MIRSTRRRQVIGSDPVRPRVLVVAMNYAPEVSGTAPYTYQLVEALSGNNDVTVLAGVPHYPEWKIHEGFGAWNDVRLEGRVEVRRLRHFVPRHPSSLSRIFHELSFAIRVLSQRTGRLDVVLTVSPPLIGAFAALLRARRSRVPLGLIVQDIYTAGIKELAKNSSYLRIPALLMSKLEKLILGRATSIVTIDERFAAALVRIAPTAKGHITTIRNWTHIPDVSISRSDYRSQLEWIDKHVLLHAGNMGEKQGLENLVEAARDADRRSLPILHVLMGDGSQRQFLQEMGAGIKSLRFLPSAADTDYAQILRAADALVINERPGVVEMSLPSKLSSYCAAGRPIIAAVDPSGVTAATLMAAGAGVVVPPGEPHLFNSAALNLLSDEVKTKDFSTRGQEYARHHFSAASAINGYFRWLERLLEAHVAEVDDAEVDVEGQSSASIQFTSGDAR